MNQFTIRFKSRSNADLIRIINNQEDYQAEAVEAAQSEINLRNLSYQELTDARNILETELREKQEQSAKKLVAERKLRNLWAAIFETINPIQQSALTTEKLIRLLTLVFGLIAILRWFDQFELILYIISDSVIGWDISIVKYLLPLLLLPISVVLFWKRKKIGWILFAAYLTYSTLAALGILILTWNEEPLGIPLLDNFFPQTSKIIQVFFILFYAGVIYLSSKTEIKGYFKIDRYTAIGTITIAGILTIISYLPHFLH